MATVNRTEFLKRQMELQERPARTGISYFKLPKDGDEAYIRFIYSDPDQIEVETVHSVRIDGRFRRVSCPRDFREPLSACPICEAGGRLENRCYVKMLVYTRDEDGKIVTTPSVWDRPASMVKTLSEYFGEYGDISDLVFKVKRSGSTMEDTTYNFFPQSASIYNETLYPKDFSAFDNYSVVGTAVLNLSVDELSDIVAKDSFTKRPAQKNTQAPQGDVPTLQTPRVNPSMVGFDNGYPTGGLTGVPTGGTRTIRNI